MRSIRSYLLTRLLGGAALVLAVAGLVVFLVVARSLEAQFDRNLSDRVQGFASLFFQTKNELSFEFSDELMPEYDRAERPAYFEIWLDDGQLVERSNSLGEADLRVRGPVADQPRHWTAPLPDGRRGRYVARRLEVHHVYPEEGPDRPQAAVVHVVVARGREDLLAAERDVLLGCAAVALVLMALIGVLSWTAVKRGLVPADRLASALDRIRVDDLPERFELGELPTELAPVAEKTGALIRRVETALERERRTTADIAHELRTPISELLTVSEVALRTGAESEGGRRALGTVRDVAWRMGRSVSTLLKLARLEMGAESFAHGEVDLGALVAEQLRPLAAIGRDRGLTVENDVAPGERVEGDRDVLAIVTSNLLSNALYYSPAGGRVACRLERDARPAASTAAGGGDRIGGNGTERNGTAPKGAAGAASWLLVVENDCAGLAADDLAALSQPFWRKDRARADRDRSGLGLALSCALADRAGLQLAFELEGETFRATLSSGAAPATEAGTNGSAPNDAEARPGGSITR